MMARYYIYLRFWPGFKIDSGFPFRQFNPLLDAQIPDLLDEYAHKWEHDNKDFVPFCCLRFSLADLAPYSPPISARLSVWMCLWI